jgi:hypothetical protein
MIIRNGTQDLSNLKRKPDLRKNRDNRTINMQSLASMVKIVINILPFFEPSNVVGFQWNIKVNKKSLE